MCSSLARRLCGRNVHVFNVAYGNEIVSELILGEQHQAILADSEQLEDVDMFNYLGPMFITNIPGTEVVRNRTNFTKLCVIHN